MRTLPLAAALALSLSVPALAHEVPAFRCSNATLKGAYAFGLTNYTPPPSQDIPTHVVTGIVVFDGQGNFTQRDYQGDNLAGPDFAPVGQEQGTYIVNSNCTGSVVLNLNVPNVPAGTSSGVIDSNIVISDGGRHFHLVVAKNNPPGSAPGSALHPTQTSLDGWKVAAEQDADDFVCSNATLKGEYSFGATNYTPPPSQDIPTKVITGIKFFDGNGHLTQQDYQGDDLAGPDFAPRGRETGTYTVNSDCTASMVINANAPGFPAGTSGQIDTRFVISDGGRHIHEVVAENFPPGSAVALHPTQTSADDWKVAPEEETPNQQ